MKHKFLIILFLISTAGMASPPEKGNPAQLHFGTKEFTEALSYYSGNDGSEVQLGNLSKHFAHLRKKQAKFKQEEQFVAYVYYYVHRKLLKKYSEYASLDQTLNKGLYDCVTATAVYAYFLSELSISFSVVETNYHLYMLAFPGNINEVLIETTDPVSGFVSDDSEIAERKIAYAKGNNEIRTNQVDLGWEIETYLKGSELTGLLLFNQSVKHFNSGNKKKAIKLAKAAIAYYPSPRIKTYVNYVMGKQLASL